MATEDQRLEVQETLSASLDLITSYTAEILVRRDALGSELSFEEGKPSFEKTIELFQKLKRVNLNVLTFNILKMLLQQTNSAIEIFKNIQSYSPSVENAQQIRTQLLDQARDAYDSYFQHFFPIIAYDNSQNIDVETQRESITTILGELNNAKAEVNDKLDEAQSALEAIRSVSIESGVSRHADLFRNQSKTDGENSRPWFWLTGVFGLAALALSFYSIYFFSSGDVILSVSQAIQLAVAKLIGFSALSFGMIWSARNFSAHKHNQVVNTHRQNALSTFETFVEGATGDADARDDVRNAVLLKATESVFAPVASGYANSTSAQIPSNPMLGIVRASASKSGAGNE